MRHVADSFGMCYFPLQEVNYKTHKASKVLILGNMKMLFTTGTSRWNDRQIALWDQVGSSIYEIHLEKLFL